MSKTWRRYNNQEWYDEEDNQGKKTSSNKPKFRQPKRKKTNMDDILNSTEYADENNVIK